MAQVWIFSRSLELCYFVRSFIDLKVKRLLRFNPYKLFCHPNNTFLQQVQGGLSRLVYMTQEMHKSA